MNLIELGTIFREKRQSKNLSIADISKAIKIPQQSLIALEQGDLGFIGYETYYKNFLKCYAVYLGYDVEEYQQLIKNVDEFSEQIAPPKSLEVQLAETQPELAKPRGRKLAVQLFILAVIGGSAYFYFSHGDVLFGDEKENTPVIEKQTKPASSVVAVDKNVEPAKEPVLASEPENETTEAVLQAENEKSDVQAAAENVIQKQEVSDTQKPTETVAQDTAQKSSGAVQQELPFDLQAFLSEYPSAQVIDWESVAEPQKGEQQAVMYANQDCWMQYRQDDKSGHFIIKKGEQRVFNFRKNLQFKIANGSAITLFHDRKPVDVGDSSKLREINLE